MALPWLSSIFMHNQMDGRRSSALTPLLWLVMLLVVLTSVVAGFRSGPIWIVEAAVALIVFVVVAILVAYFLFAVRNPDLLRSEHYSLSKMAIQQGMKGDSISGPLDANLPEPPPGMLDPISSNSARTLAGGTQ